MEQSHSLDRCGNIYKRKAKTELRKSRAVVSNDLGEKKARCTELRSEERSRWMCLPGIRNDSEEAEVSAVELLIRKA
jgi:hypothetical protein